MFHDVTQCEICHKAPSKYKCPRCSVRTCCLACVKSHKDTTGCDGKRNRAAFREISDFTDEDFYSDLHLLEDAQRTVSTAKRMKQSNIVPRSLRALQQEAKKRNIELISAPLAMEARQKNSSMFHHKEQTIYWRVEWLFLSGPDRLKLSDRRLSEKIPLKEALEKHFDDIVVQQRLRAYRLADIATWQVLMKAERRPANDVRYHRLNLNHCLKDALAGKVVVEHPSLLIILPGDLPLYPLLEGGDMSISTSSSSDSSSDSSDSDSSDSDSSDSDSSDSDDTDAPAEAEAIAVPQLGEQEMLSLLGQALAADGLLVQEDDDDEDAPPTVRTSRVPPLNAAAIQELPGSDAK